jgi:hypothetical protein
MPERVLQKLREIKVLYADDGVRICAETAYCKARALGALRQDSKLAGS